MEMKKTVTKVLNILTIVICVIIFIIAILTLSSMGKGYTNFFGSTMLAVKSNSMVGENPDSFNKGDLLYIKLLNDEQKLTLEEGQVITFMDMIEGKSVPNTHRIISVSEFNGKIYYLTHGDNAPLGKNEHINSSAVVGLYSGKTAGIGNIILFFQSTWGFFGLVVVPSILAVIYCIYRLVITLREYNKEKLSLDREKMKEELLQEISNNEKQEK